MQKQYITADVSDGVHILSGVKSANPKTLLICALETGIVTFGFGS